jgi:hypothetical protein
MNAKKVSTLSPVRDANGTKHVRLEVSAADYRRLAGCARDLGLILAAYSRMAVLERIKADEAKRA